MQDLRLGSAIDSVPEIAEEAVLWRRIQAHKVVFDENQQRMRPSSDSFKDNPNGTPMSVFDASRCAGPEQVLVGHEGYLLASISAAQVISAGMSIVRKEEEGIGHCEVIGKKSKGISSQWAKDAKWVVGPVNTTGT